MSARIAITTEFLSAYARLDSSIQRQVKKAFTKFDQLRHAGGHIEKLNGTIDPHVRSMRVNDNFRVILLAPETGDLYVWHTVMAHDDAYAWVGRNRFSANTATGAFEVINVGALEALQADLQSAPERVAKGAFSHVSDADLVRLGIGSDRLPLVRLLTTEDEVLSMAGLLPAQQADVLCMLYEGVSVEDVWEFVVSSLAAGDPAIDLESAALSPASADHVHIVTGPDELEWILNQPFDKWRTFLHQSQRRLAYRDVYNGPVRVTGGAGTGKTVVALHRVKALIDGGHDGRILFTTFTRNLVHDIERRLRQLLTPEQLKQVDVLNIDRVVMSIVKEQLGKTPRIFETEAVNQLWQEAAAEVGVSKSPEFLAEEWDRVVVALGITSRDQYLAAPRAGRGVRLSRAERSEVWNAIEAFGRHAARTGKFTFPQLALEATRVLQARSVRPYTAVIIDEAQDLHPATWRMIRELVEPGRNDLFIVGDAHQRIYGPKASLRRCGIEVVGRSFRLRINYRTTLQILRWSRALLAGTSFDDLDDGSDTLSGYTSLLHGSAPVVTGFASAVDEERHIIDWIEQRVGTTDSYGSFCVVARTGTEAHRLAEVLRAGGLPVEEIQTTAAPDEHSVHVATMHRVKGLEYRYMVVADVSAGSVPPGVISRLRHDSPEEYERQLTMERSLLFVSCTRARDEVLITWVGSPSTLLPRVTT